MTTFYQPMRNKNIKTKTIMNSANKNRLIYNLLNWFISFEDEA